MIHTLQEPITPSRIGSDWHQPALYVRVRAQILETIRSGQWRPGEVIPPEKKLCELFGVSIGTLRKAVDELTASGILIRRQGKGTFVASHNQDRYLFFFFHLLGQDGHKEYPKVEFQKFQAAKADKFSAQALNLNVDDPLWHVSNRLSLRGEIVSLDEIYLPQKLFADLSEARLKVRKTTLYQMYQDVFGQTIMRATERVRATRASAAQAKRLKVKTGEPLLQIIRIAYGVDNDPIELRYSFVQTANCEYRPDVFVRA